MKTRSPGWLTSALPSPDPTQQPKPAFSVTRAIIARMMASADKLHKKTRSTTQ